MCTRLTACTLKTALARLKPENRRNLSAEAVEIIKSLK